MMDRPEEAKAPPRFRAKKPGLHARHPQPGYVLRGRVWLEKDGELYIGGGRLMLLENIARHGSIAAAARAMGLGYRNAWLWVEAMNRLAPSPLVEIVTGGVGGGHARLTDEGREVLNRYRELCARLQDFINSEQAQEIL